MKILTVDNIARVVGKVAGPAAKTLTPVAKKSRSFLFEVIPRLFNDLVRAIDRRSSSVLHRENGHPFSVTLLGIGSLLYVLLGPSLSLAWFLDWPTFGIWWKIIALVVATVFLWVYVRGAANRPGILLHGLHAPLIITAAVLVLLLYVVAKWIPVPTTEASGGIYPHLYAAVALSLMAFSYVSLRLARRVFVPFEKPLSADGSETETERLARTFRHTNFVVDVDNPPPYSRVRIINTLIEAPTRKPLLLLIMPAVVIIFVPDPDTARVVGFVLLGIAWLLLTWGLYHKHWDLFVGVVSRWFLFGAPKVISLVVIVLAVCHVLDVHYVTTILQGGPVFKLLIAAYFIAWLYEYWVNRFLYTKLLEFLRIGQPRNPSDNEWSVNLERRRDEAGATIAGDIVSLLGGSRFLVSRQKDQFRIYMPFILLDRILADAQDNDRHGLNATIGSLKGRIHTYFAIHNLFVAVVVAVFLGWQVALSDNEPVITLQEATGVKLVPPVDLVALLTERAKQGRPAVFLAASGGGTRAALYTTSVLCGLSARGLLDDLVLASGVSGGGAALAYLAANHEKLKEPACDPTRLVESGYAGLWNWNQSVKTMQRMFTDSEPEGQWIKFFRIMQSPFIEDVLEGVADLRIAFSEPNGALLSESFLHRFDGNNKSIMDVSKFGIILNTALTGHPPDKTTTDGKYAQADDTNCSDVYHQKHAGGRLVFTNLSRESFPFHGADTGDDLLKYVVVNNRHRVYGSENGNVPLHLAAALSANFPPVFSDAGISLLPADAKENEFGCHTYWVTDGGASDNRGAISLLLALGQALSNFEDKNNLPDIHVVIADASAESIDYSPARGFSAIFGSSSKFASEVIRRLHVENIERFCSIHEPGKVTCPEAKDNGMYLYPLDMPSVFTTRKGLGTHWKMPWWIIMTDPTQSDGTQAETARIWQWNMVSAIAALHDNKPCAERMKSAGLKDTPAGWICDDTHDDVWAQLPRLTASSQSSQ